MSKISYEIELDGLTTVEVIAEEQAKEVVIFMFREKFIDQPVKIRMDYLQAEKFYLAIKGCVDYAERSRK